MSALQDKIIKTIKQYNLIEPGDSIVIGVSGGPDSICLLHALWGQSPNTHLWVKGDRPQIFVAHINHKIRKEADEEEEFVKEFCKSIGVECFTKSADKKITTEEEGRLLRYAFFEEVARNVGAFCKRPQVKIATAHNANDNAETVLFNILRGSGISGLKGIMPKRDNYIRPLINISRKEIEQYCKENNLNPRYDKTNNESIYTRNKIRNELIPYLSTEFNPNIIDTLNRLSKIVLDEEEYFSNIVNIEYKNMVIQETKDIIILDLKKLNKQDLIIKRRVILYVIGKILGTAKDISKIHVEDIIKLCENNVGNKFLIPNKHIKVSVNHGKIFIAKIKTM